MNNFWQRTFTGAGFVAAVLVGIYYQQEYYTLSLLFLIFNLIGLFEFYGMAAKTPDVCIKPVFPVLCGTVLFLSFVLYASAGETWGFVIYGLLLLGLFVAELFSGCERPMSNLALYIMGNVYVSLPFGMLTMISMRNISWTFALFVIIWVFDTGAYCSGRLLGRHKMFERISPKKTWEGEIGGVLLAIVASLCFAWMLPSVPFYFWLAYGLLIAVAGTFGDLAESMMKRSVHIKDSGNVLPGHGGILDRFDSLLFAAPVAFFFLEIFGLGL